jgi:photosystem II stability/assembly factor-like uncharacterized protein
MLLAGAGRASVRTSIWVVAGAALLVASRVAAGDGTWKRIGPEGGKVSVLAVHPSNESVVFAGTEDGVYRSDDGGQTWSRKSEGIGSRTPEAIVINPEQPDEVFVLVWGRRSLFRSIDGGDSWENLQVRDGQPLDLLRYAPNPFALYVIDDDRYLFSSADSGETWSTMSFDLGTIHDFAVHPVHPERMAVAVGSEGVAVSADSGNSWTTCGSSPSDHAWTVTFDPIDPNVLYVPGTDVVHRSMDGCDTWSASPRPGIDVFSFLKADADRPDTLYADTTDGLFVSSDGGQDWRAYGPSIDLLRTYDLRSAPANPNVVYVAAEAPDARRGVFRSGDGGTNWIISMDGLYAQGIEDFVINPSDSTIAYAGATFSNFRKHGVFKSSDSGTSWSLSEGAEEAGPIVAIDPLSPDTVYTTTSDWGILKSTDGGGTWFEVWQGLSGKRILGIEVDSHRSGTLYMVVKVDYQEAYRSDDGGRTWVRLPLSDSAEVNAIFSDPHSVGVVYAATWYRLYKSYDFGDSWVSISTGLDSPPNCWEWACADYHLVTDLNFDPTDPQTMYASTNVGPFRTRDGGRNWEPVRDGMTICCLPVWSDECDDLTKSVYLGCEGWPEGFAIDPDRPWTVYTATSLGTYRSYDRGGSWVRIIGPDETNPESIATVGRGVILGASERAGVLRLGTAPLRSPRRPSRRVAPGHGVVSKVIQRKPPR